jgi:hypothetical protein
VPTVSIPEIYRTPLVKIASMPEAEVVELREALSSIGVTLKPLNLTAQVRGQIKRPSPELDDIVQVLVGLSSARAGSDVSIEEFSKDVAKSMTRRKDAPKDYDESVFEKTLSSLLGIESLALSARAAEIQHDYERVFASARIVSDIRSVFGTSNIDPVGAMIVHNLKITFFEEGRVREAFFALDNADLIVLRQVIDRAELKTPKLETMIKTSGVQYFESK